MSQWYYAHGGQQKGPVPLSELQRLADNGEFDPENDLVWKEGMDDWKPGSTVPEVASALAPPSPAAAEPGTEPPGAPPEPVPATPPAGPSTYQAPVGTPAGPVAPAGAPMPGSPSSGMAMGSMICGILAFLGCFVWCLSIPLALVAIVLGHMTGARIKADPARFGGKGMAMTGLITGYLAILFAVLFLALGLWIQSLSPDEIRNLDWIPPEQQEEIIRQLEQQGQLGEP